MTHYKNLAGKVGICSYELGEKTIKIQFHTHKSRFYSAQNTHEEHIDKMMHLAIQGYGLNDYIIENENNFDITLLD